MRRCLWMSAGVVLAVGAAAFGQNTVPLRVVAYNVLEGIGAPGSTAANAVGAFLTTNDLDGPGPNSGLNPDIVALQECRGTADMEAFRNTFLPGYQFRRGSVVDAGGNYNAYFLRPDIEVLDLDEYGIGGPRPLVRLTVRVPGAAQIVTLYNGHFKAFSDAASVAQRRTNANESGIAVYDDRTFGLDLDDNLTRETPAGHSILLGDLNSNNNGDGTLNGVFTHAANGQPTGLRNLPVESLGGRAVGGAPIIVTFPPSSRLDYICLDEELTAPFDTNGNGTLDQNEINAIGFVYFSGDDNGRLSNGNSTATSFGSDHRPVVFDIRLPAALAPCPGDTNGDRVVNFLDLNAVLSQFGQGGTGLPGDVNGDGVVNFTDLNIVLGAFGTVC